MLRLRPSAHAALAAGLLTVAALSGCGSGDDDPAASTGADVATTTTAGSALLQGAARGGLPSVVAVSVNTGGATRNGSGTVLTPGVVLTDASLVQTPGGAPAAGVTVREDGGEEHSALVQGIDELTGLAALRVRTLTSVPAAKLAPEPAVLGQDVAGLGFVSSRRPALRPGTVVTTERAVRAEGIAEVGLFETSAQLGAQGLGGPIVDGQGRVLGITTKAMSSIIPGTSLVLPARSAERVSKALADRGRVVRAYLGLETVGVTPTRAQELKLKTSSGVLLRSVTPGSPASFAGFKTPTGSKQIGGRAIPSGGDVIIAIDRSKVREPEDLDRAMANRAPGRRVIIRVIRGSSSKAIGVTLGER